MTLPGYVDYARTSLAGGFELAGGNATFPSTTTIFQGYVGSWNFVNFYWSSPAATDEWMIEVAFYKDSTFAQFVGASTAIRGQPLTASWRQFSVLGPWMLVQVIPKFGGNSTGIIYELWATNGKASASQLGQCTAPLVAWNLSIPASSVVPYNPTVLMPGLGVINARWSVNTSWAIQINYYDFGAANYLLLYYWNNLVEGYGFTDTIMLPDSPMQVLVSNINTSPETLQGSITQTFQ